MGISGLRAAAENKNTLLCHKQSALCAAGDVGRQMAAVTRRHAAEVTDMSDTKVLLRLAQGWILGFGRRRRKTTGSFQISVFAFDISGLQLAGKNSYVERREAAGGMSYTFKETRYKEVESTDGSLPVSAAKIAS